MGIDKSNVRYRRSTPARRSRSKHYQQESGRAGRDGLEAECCLLYSPGDFSTWRSLQDELPASRARDRHDACWPASNSFCTGVTLPASGDRRILRPSSSTAKTAGPATSASAKLDLVDEPLIVGQKILSCVVRLEQSFGGDYTAAGAGRLARTAHPGQRARPPQHLGTARATHDKRTIRGWIEQLVGQRFLEKHGEYSVLQVTPAGTPLAARRGDAAAAEGRPPTQARIARSRKESWEGVDRGLFERAAGVCAAQRRTSAASRRSSSSATPRCATWPAAGRRRRQQLLEVHGVGERKSAEYGVEFLQAIADYCRLNDLEHDMAGEAPRRRK